MLARVAVVTLNTYREAVRARVLHGLFGLALLTAAYALVVGAFALRDSMRVISDLGSASISIYGVIVAVVLGATSLYRELELKTIFPILARPLRRTEYLVGKYVGTLLTLLVFIAANSGALLIAIASFAGEPPLKLSGLVLGATAVTAIAAWRAPRWRTYLPIPWSFALLALSYVCASGAPDDRRVVFGGALLTLCEVSIVTALATLFAAFSSPFLTAVLTFGVFVIGRSADSLGHLPARVFGEPIKKGAVAVSKFVPNLMVYVPPRTLLTGEASQIAFGSYIGLAATQALGWAVLLLGAASLIFRRRDFL